MDYEHVLGIDVNWVNSPDDSSNAGDPVKKDPLDKKGERAAVDPIKAAANWKAVYDAGVRFAIIKATEWGADPYFRERMQYAKAAGMLRGAYILAHFELDNIKDQADLFIKTVGSDQGELPPVLDLESPPGGDKKWPVGKPLFKKIKDLLDRMEQAFGRKPLIYTSQSIVRQYEIKSPPWGMDYDIWVATYPYRDVAKQLQYSDPNNPPKWSSTYPPQPDGYKPWVIWQWTEKGRVLGMNQENVDIDSFKGTYEQFLTWAKAKAPVPNPNPIPHIDPIPPDPIPDPKPDPDPQPDPEEEKYILHTVTSTDSLGVLAQNNHTTIDKIMALNPQIKNRNVIQDGWVLKIPTS